MRRKKPFVRKPFVGTVAVEWQIGRTVMLFCHNDRWNWRAYATFWRIHVFRVPA